MKRLVFVLFSLFVWEGLCFSQNAQDDPYDFKHDITNTEGYEGMWLYQSNDTIFKLRLVRMEIPKYGKCRSFVGGLYSISIGGKELINQLYRDHDHLPKSYRVSEMYRIYRIIARNHRTKDNKVDDSYLDFTVCLPRKDGQNTVAFFLSTNTLKLIAPDKLEWKITDHPDYCFSIDDEKPKGNPPSYAYPLPAHAILTKVTEW